MLRSSILAELPGLLAELGHSHVLKEMGIDTGALQDTERPIRLRDAGALLEGCVARTGRQQLGLLLGMRGGVATLGAVGLLAQSAPDVESALRALIDYLHHHDRGAVPTLGLERQAVTLGYAIYEPEVPATDQIYAAAMAIALQIMRELCGPHWYPTEVWLPFRKPPDASPFALLFKAPLRFDADQAALVFPAHWLKRPLARPDPDAQRTIKLQLDAADPADFVCLVRRTARSLVVRGQLSETAVAAALAVSRRTLVRLLQARDKTFRDIMNEVRLEAACQLLRDTDNSVAHVAASLGYANASPFARAFRHWTGLRPTEWRDRHGGSRGPLRPDQFGR
jgi:AraC-like DNA-binding protein